MRSPAVLSTSGTSLAFDREHDLLYFAALKSPLDEAPRGIRVLQVQGSADGLSVLPQDWPADEVVATSRGQLAVAVSDDGTIAVGLTDRYRLASYSRTGVRTTVFGRDIPRPAKAAEELEQERAQAGRVVFDPAGEWLGEVTGPSRMAHNLPLFAIAGTYMATAVTADDGHAEVVVYRIAER